MSYTESQMPSIITANYTVQPYDVVIRYNSSGGVFDIQLPDPSLGRRVLRFIDTRASEADSTGVNLLQYASEKIGGVAATKNIPANTGVEAGVEFFSDLTHWRQMGITF